MDIRSRTEEKVFSFIEGHDLIRSQDRVLAGISGGADSVCLLFLLLEYRKRVPFELAVSHVNHGVRADAARDARYVEELCVREGIPFYLTEGNMEEVARREKCSREDAGRRLRYEAFGKAAADFGAGRIAVAHNANDRAETMLFHLFRGSGLRGLCGIAPRRQEIIRPILCLEREEIERYLEERGISHCEDSTNAEDDYTRNRIRHHILPCAEEQVTTGIVRHMCQTADMLSELEDYLELQVVLARQGCVSGSRERQEQDQPGARPTGYPQAERLRIQVENFLELHIVLQKHLLLSLLQELSPTGKDMLAVHVRDVLGLFTGTGNRKICLPLGVQAVRQYGYVILSRNGPDPVVKDVGSLGKLEFRQFFLESSQEIPTNRYTKWLDCDKISKPLDVRFRQTGDYITIADGRGGIAHKSLKDYMIAEKIPREDRDRIPVLAEGKHVLWLIGYRISEYYKISGNTKHVLQVQLIGGCMGGETEEEDGGTYQGTIVGRRGGCQDPGNRGTDQPGL